MVILWVLSCLAQLSEADQVFVPTVQLTPVSSDCICDVIFKNSTVVQLCDANVLHTTTQNSINCTILNIPRNGSKAELLKAHNKICKILEDELCGSRANQKFSLFDPGTLKGRITPLCPPADYKDFKDEKCFTSDWRCTYSSNKWVPDNHQSLQLLNNEECKLYWLSRIRHTAMCVFYPNTYSCEDGNMLACEKNNRCELTGFVYWVNYSNLTTVTRIIKHRHWEKIYPCN